MKLVAIIKTQQGKETVTMDKNWQGGCDDWKSDRRKIDAANAETERGHKAADTALWEWMQENMAELRHMRGECLEAMRDAFERAAGFAPDPLDVYCDEWNSLLDIGDGYYE